MFQNGASIVKKVKGVYAFKVKNGPGGKEGSWVVDVKNGNGSVKYGSDAKADCTITMGDADMLNMMTGKLNPQQVGEKREARILNAMYWLDGVLTGEYSPKSSVHLCRSKIV